MEGLAAALLLSLLDLYFSFLYFAWFAKETVLLIDALLQYGKIRFQKVLKMDFLFLTCIV